LEHFRSEGAVYAVGFISHTVEVLHYSLHG